jgi:hypothetical protein
MIHTNTEDNIETDLAGIGWESVDWIRLRICGGCCEHYEHSVSIKGGKFLDQLTDY